MAASSSAWPITFLTGAKPGKRPANNTVPDQNVKRKKRTFQNKWKENRQWLKYDEMEGIMTCSVCISFPHSKSNLKNKNLFITGCSNFRVSSVVDHENSRGHKGLTDSVSKQAAESHPKATPELTIHCYMFK